MRDDPVDVGEPAGTEKNSQERSFQSVIEENVSAPMTRIRSAAPAAIVVEASANAYTKPLHTASRMPRFSWIHASVVSSPSTRSALVTIRSGTAEPVARIETSWVRSRMGCGSVAGDRRGERIRRHHTLRGFPLRPPRDRSGAPWPDSLARVATTRDPRTTLITIDVEDHGPTDRPPRFRTALAPLLDALRDRRVTATFFVVGTLVPTWADELTQLTADGHEIGLHGHTHRFLKTLGPATFRDELRAGREAIANVTGSPPVGFRAPYFSLTADTPWAPDILTEEGFVYSSSVLPAWNPQAGMPGVPKTPFRWPSGLVEFPVPVFGVRSLGLPVLGGAYLRLLPSSIVRLAERSSRDVGRWTYAHPYDFDADEQFFRRPGQSWLVAKLLFARRRLMLPRVMDLVGSGGGTLGSLAHDERFVSALPQSQHPRTADVTDRAASAS